MDLDSETENGCHQFQTFTSKTGCDDVESNTVNTRKEESQNVEETNPNLDEEHDDILQLEMDRNDIQSEISRYQMEADIDHDILMEEDDPNWSSSLFDSISINCPSTSSDDMTERRKRENESESEDTSWKRKYTKRYKKQNTVIEKQKSDSSLEYSDTESWLKFWEKGNLRNNKTKSRGKNLPN